MGVPFEHGLHTTLIAMRLADRLAVDRENASQTYYACLLSHSGCTTDAYVTPEVFGDSLTTHFHPVMRGSGREVLMGLIRALPDPESTGPVRAVQLASRLPKMAREMRPHLTATCEVVGMLADRLGPTWATPAWKDRGRPSGACSTPTSAACSALRTAIPSSPRRH